MNRLGTKQYEFSDHLGNVLVTILDKRTGTGNAGGNYTGWLANVSAVNDYYPFGMLMEERRAGIGGRYSFNGMEQDNEVKGTGNSLDFGARMYDSRIARWSALDPLQAKYPSISPYAFVANSPLMFIDPDGKQLFLSYIATDKFGRKLRPQVFQYIDGKFYSRDANGNYTIEYEGGIPYVSDVLEDLNQLKNDHPLANQLITDLEKNDSKNYIRNEVSEHYENTGQNSHNQPSFATSFTRNKDEVVIYYNRGRTSNERNTHTRFTLLEELKHTFNINYSKTYESFRLRTRNQRSNLEVNFEENDANAFVNAVMKKVVGIIRTSYSGKKLDEDMLNNNPYENMNNHEYRECPCQKL